MIRVLHLLDADADYQTERGALHLSRDIGPAFETVSRTIGSGGDYHNAAVAVVGLRHETGPLFDVCHAWGAKALAVAALSGGVARLVYSPTIFPSVRSLRWLRAIMSYREVQVVCPTATLRRAAIEHGTPVERTHLIRPGVDFSRIRRKRIDPLRQTLGFGDSDRVLLVAGESTRESAHEEAVWAASILHVLDERYKVLAWGRGSRAAAIERFGRRQHKATLVTLAERRVSRRVEFEELLGASDIALVTAHQPASTLATCVCMAAGLPIVATVARTTSELLEDRHTALMAQAGSARALARRILDLEEDPNLQWSISDMARTEAYEYVSMTRFLTQYRALYRQVAAGEGVELPEHAPGAGLRFHGRG